MKAFIVLACLAVASADPTSYTLIGDRSPYDLFGRTYGVQTPLVGFRNAFLGAQTPFVGLRSSLVQTPVSVGVTPLNKDQAAIQKMIKQVALSKVQLDAQNAGRSDLAADAYYRQMVVQDVEKPLLENKNIFTDLVKREAESYTPAQVAAMGLFNPSYITYGRQFGQYPLVNFRAAPLTQAIYPGITYPRYFDYNTSPLQPYSQIVKRSADADADADPTLVSSPFQLPIYGAPSYLRSSALRYPVTDVYNRVSYTSSVVPAIPTVRAIPSAIRTVPSAVRTIPFNTQYVNNIRPYVNNFGLYA